MISWEEQLEQLVQTYPGTVAWHDRWSAFLARIEQLEKEREEVRGSLERIRDMAVRPQCLCGRPTGTAAIRSCAESALQQQSEES